MQSLHSGSSACLKNKAQTLDAKFAFWAFCLPKLQGPNLKFKAQTLDAKFAFWVFCLPKVQGPNLGCKVCILGLLPAQKSKAQTLDAKFAFWVFCLPKIQGPNLGCKVCIPKIQGPNLGCKVRAQNPRPKPWMQSLHSGSSACLKSKAQTLDAKFAFWVKVCICLPKIQGPNLGCKVCILSLLPS